MVSYYISGVGEKIVVDEKKPIGTKGAQGEVFPVIKPKKYKNYCVKIFHLSKRNQYLEEKIKYMVKNQPSQLSDSRYLICWAVAILYTRKIKSDNFVGYMMPRADENSYLLYHISRLKIRQKLRGGWLDKYDRETAKGIQARLKLIVNLCIPLNIILSTNKYVLVDLKPQNILVSNSGKVSIIDTDSIQISDNGNVVFSALACTPEYSPPEIEKYKNLSSSNIHKSWDYFSLGVIIYEILIGVHPYTGSSQHPYSEKNDLRERIVNGLSMISINSSYVIDKTLPKPHANYFQLPHELKILFHHTFNIGHNFPDRRTPPNEWGEVIFNLLKKNKKIKLNKKNRRVFKPKNKTSMANGNKYKYFVFSWRVVLFISKLIYKMIVFIIFFSKENYKNKILFFVFLGTVLVVAFNDRKDKEEKSFQENKVSNQKLTIDFKKPDDRIIIKLSEDYKMPKERIKYLLPKSNFLRDAYTKKIKEKENMGLAP